MAANSKRLDVGRGEREELGLAYREAVQAYDRAAARSAIRELVRLDQERGCTYNVVQPVELNVASMRKLLGEYGISGFESASSVIREKELPNRNYIIRTEGRPYFLKQFMNFRPQKIEGLYLSQYLVERGFPAIRVINARDGLPWTVYGGGAFALSELVEFPQNGPMVARDAREAGVALAEFHRLASRFPVSESDRSFSKAQDSMSTIFGNMHPRTDRQRNILNFLNDHIGDIEPNPERRADLPRAVCHTEFMPNAPERHVAFINGKVVMVADFDTIERGHMLFDLGTLMRASLVQKGGTGSGIYEIDFNILGKTVDGYSDGRRKSGKPLTDYEEKQMYEAFLNGLFRYIAWRGADVGDFECIGMAAEMMQSNKEEFTRKLGGARGGVASRA